MKRTAKTLWRFIKPMLVTGIGCNIILYWLKIRLGKIDEVDFLFTFTGIILGFAITIYAFIIPIIDKITEQVTEGTTIIQSLKDRREAKIKSVVKELQENIIFIFTSLCVIGLFYIIECPYHELPLFGSYALTTSMFVSCTKLAIFVLNIYAIYDLIIVSFKLSDVSGVIKHIKNTIV